MDSLNWGIVRSQNPSHVHLSAAEPPPIHSVAIRISEGTAQAKYRLIAFTVLKLKKTFYFKG